MAKIVYEGKIDGKFNGFDEEAIFKMQNGDEWVQAEYKYWYHYDYCPVAIISEENGRYILTVQGQSVPVQKRR